ncbi:unnamed protein product [Sphagnum balticum]
MTFVGGDIAEMREAEQQQPENANSFTLGVSEGAGPEHLVVLVNGIVGSVENWRFAAEQFKKKLADKVVVHCNACNSALRTFNGVDVMGNRLAEEVQDVVDANPGVTKISFLSHSLGGLVSRYAIGQLYAPQGGRSLLQERASSRFRNGEILVEHTKVGEAERVGDHDATTVAAPLYGSIAGLEPINFITVATPHLGSKGNRHVPFLFGISTLERVAPMISHWFIGRTGRHLFLADGKKTLQPLLQRMVTDCHEGRFMSALWAFKQRTAYANIVYDHMVGWRTASIRRESEMPQVLISTIESYPHIVRDEELPAVDLKPATMQTREPASDFAEEVMLAGLQQVAWRRVDVSFLGARVKYQAHNTIQVKSAAVHLEGEDVIAHIIDKHF